MLDVRTPGEFQLSSLPGARNVPGSELVFEVLEATRGGPEEPLVVVNCAGRTRSILGAYALWSMGLGNVRALRNGTMGWLLAGHELAREASP